MNFLVPQGIGDSVWALLKVQDIAAKFDNVINIFIACIDKNNVAECRALDFVKRFRFVNSAEMYEMPIVIGQGGCLLQLGPVADENGFYRYISEETKLNGIDFVLIPNYTLERGIRIEEWLPGYKINWQIMDDFDFGEVKDLGGYAVFFLSAKDNNTISGHNRNGLWKPEDWVQLGSKITKEFGLKILVVGANYDLSYYADCISPLLDYWWINRIGDYSVAQTFSIIKKARFVISYQSGIGIVASYMGVPTGIFWRAKGDSISPTDYISFEEEMASAWADPAMIESGKHLPLIYGRHDVNYVIDEIKKRAW